MSSQRWSTFAHAAIGLAVVLGLLTPYLRIPGARWLGLAQQGLPTVVMLIWVAVCPTIESRRYRWAIVAAFALSLVGGFLLGLPGRFVAGILGFLAANIAYLTALTSGVRFARRAIPFVLLGASSASVLALAWPRIPGDQRIAVVVYAVAIASVAAQAVCRGLVTRTTGTTAAAIGATLLLVSDSAIAMNRFYASFTCANDFIMVTYFVGQWLIAASVSAFAPSARDRSPKAV